MKSVEENIDSKEKNENKKTLIKDRKWRKRIDETERISTYDSDGNSVGEEDILNSKDKN